MIDLEGLSYIDISPKISEKTDVFPGDQPYKRNVSHDYSRGNHMCLSSVTTTLHIGAHADGPVHYRQGGEGIGERSLDYYMGLCQVVDVSKKVARGSLVVREDIEKTDLNASRVLFKTETFNHSQWNNDFCALSSALVKDLAEKGVKLVGIDTPSIDPEESKELKAHAVVADNNMAILEGIDLTSVSEGLYQLIALPLPLSGADASPVRAILIKV